MKCLLFLLLAACAYAQSGIDVPMIGAFVDASGNVRPVQGIAGNFLLAPATAGGVLSAACSGQLCLAKTDTQILSATGAVDAAAGPAVFALDHDSAIAYFPQSRTFARWSDNTLQPLGWTVDGDVLSIRVRDRSIEMAVRRDDGVWIVGPDGSVADRVGDATGPVLLLHDGVLFASGDELILRRFNASESHFALQGAESIAAMGPHYAAVRAGAVNFALRTDAGREELYVLPGNAP